MSQEIKQQIHTLVDQCKDEIVLEETKALLESASGSDWWEELSEDDKKLVMESEEQYGKGNFINHQELISRFEEWKKK
ncbi:MAG TPA: hypothetical protein VGO58_00155 [Chitinophagaceae bacterium]|jgi:hypothetical protein|nr:hypothetical protein [Chitinophagaceae bacterium]